MARPGGEMFTYNTGYEQRTVGQAEQLKMDHWQAAALTPRPIADPPTVRQVLLNAIEDHREMIKKLEGHLHELPTVTLDLPFRVLDDIHLRVLGE